MFHLFNERFIFMPFIIHQNTNLKSCLNKHYELVTLGAFSLESLLCFCVSVCSILLDMNKHIPCLKHSWFVTLEAFRFLHSECFLCILCMIVFAHLWLLVTPCINYWWFLKRLKPFLYEFRFSWFMRSFITCFSKLKLATPPRFYC